MGILFGIVVSGLVVSGTLVLRAHRTKTETNFRIYGQASEFARAGLIESLGWFRRQSAQPVLDFEPIRDLLATPPILDTEEPDVGIVRQFQIAGSVWGRYEVWKEWETDPDPTRLAWRRQVQANDVSAMRSASGAGSVWQVRSVGYVFRRVDAARAFDEPPNRVLASAVLETELRRLRLAPPGPAAICVSRADNCTIDRSVNIQGQAGIGIVYPNGTGSVNVVNGPIINGAQQMTGMSNYDGSVAGVFGVTVDDLRSLADDRIVNQADFPSPLPARSFYFVEVPTLDLTSARPLRGNGIVFVRGDVNIDLGSTSFFTGFLYVDGNVTVRETMEFNGTLVCTGTLAVQGQSDWVNLTYDVGALNALRTEIGQYRLSGAIRRVSGGN
jgi:hypothetical protein